MEMNGNLETRPAKLKSKDGKKQSEEEPQDEGWEEEEEEEEDEEEEMVTGQVGKGKKIKNYFVIWHTARKRTFIDLLGFYFS